jgi:hypothetical protein
LLADKSFAQATTCPISNKPELLTFKGTPQACPATSYCKKVADKAGETTATTLFTHTCDKDCNAVPGTANVIEIKCPRPSTSNARLNKASIGFAVFSTLVGVLTLKF